MRNRRQAHRRVGRPRRRMRGAGKFKDWAKKAWRWARRDGVNVAKKLGKVGLKIYNDPLVRQAITSFNPGTQKYFDKGDMAQKYGKHALGLIGSGRCRNGTKKICIKKKRRRKVRGGTLGYGMY